MPRWVEARPTKKASLTPPARARLALTAIPSKCLVTEAAAINGSEAGRGDFQRK